MSNIIDRKEDEDVCNEHDANEAVTFHCLTETNEWEGEAWYHYFLDEPEVFRTLEQLMFEGDDNDYTDLETVTLTWTEAERLTNLDTGGYMQEHWFGKLTNLEGLKKADSQALYKGGIRKFGEELFENDTNEENENA